jgi:hypothetical protein
MRRRICTFVALLFLAAPLCADEEAANAPHVTADASGRCYAKSVPAESYGSRGTTSVYRVMAGADRLIETYAWYAPRVELQCNTPGLSGDAVSIVQFGPWARGRQATADHLAIAFHANGRLLRRFSTLDIAGSPDNVSASVSHYQVFGEVEGYVYAGAVLVFRLNTTDGRRLTFEPATGNLLTPTAARPNR